MIDILFIISLAAACVFVGYSGGLEAGKAEFCEQYGGTYIQEKCVVEIKELEIKK